MNALGGEAVGGRGGGAGREGRPHLAFQLQIDSPLCLRKDLESYTEKALPVNPPEWTHALF